MITPIQTVMSKTITTVPLGTTLQEASELMTEKRIRHLPITNSNKGIVGIISLRDLNLASTPMDTKVDQLMSSPVRSVDQHLSLRSAILKMLESKISCLLISDEKRAAVGIVTTDDLLWYLAHLISEEKADFLKPFDVSKLNTIGEVANELSLMGI